MSGETGLTVALLVLAFGLTSSQHTPCGDVCPTGPRLTGPRWPEDMTRDEGSRFPKAAHYWPFNATTPYETMLDVRGRSKTLTYNGVRTTYAEQLGSVLSLDGVDDFIRFRDMGNECINDPTLCDGGLTVAFWLKYRAGEFILSSGRYTNHNRGPGFQFMCQQIKHKHFVLKLSTQTREWKITINFLPKAWLHFMFTWHVNNGLRLYNNAKLVKTDNSSTDVRFLPLTSRYRTITLGRPNSLTKMNSYAKFDIGHLVIWTNELSSKEVQVAFLTVLAKTTKSLICCHFKKEDPCVSNPCYEGATCRLLDEKYECICPDISVGPCMERNGGSQGQKGVPTDAPVITSTPFTPNATKGIGATAGPSRQQSDGDSLPTVDSKFSMPHACSAGGIQCVCFNCDADSRGLKCCIDLLEPRALQEGVAITIDSITIRKFLEIEESVRQVTEKELADACQRIDCFGVSKSLKRRRRDKDGKESLHSVTNVSVVLFSILPDAPAHSKGGLTAAFYATVTSHMAASNRTKVLNGAVLADLMREKQEVLNKQLNISIGVIASWDSTNIGILSIKPGGSPSEGKESTAEDKEHMSYTIFIIILVSGIVGFLVLTAAFIFIGIRFQRRRNGEFIPTEIYTDGARRPSTPRIVVSFATDGTSGTQCTRAGQRKELRRKSTGSAGVLDEGRGARRSSTVSLGETPSLSRFVDQLYPSSVDPSTPRITDVPKKSVRRGSMGTWSTNSYEDQRILSSTSSITGLPKKQIRRGSEGTGNADGCEEQPMPLSFVYPISATTHGMPKNLAMNNPDKNSAKIPT